jgi:hypothetical protein
MLRMSGLKMLESRPIAVENVAAVTHLGQPEVQVGYMPNQLMAVERREFRKLLGEQFCDFGRIRQSSFPPSN